MEYPLLKNQQIESWSREYRKIGTQLTLLGQTLIVMGQTLVCIFVYIRIGFCGPCIVPSSIE